MIETRDTSIPQTLLGLRRKTVRELCAQYVEVFGEETRSYNKEHLIRKIAWRIQELAYGGLSERARRRAMEIANDADLRVTMPRGMARTDSPGVAERTMVTKLSGRRDRRLPLPGTLLVREYKGKDVVVRVMDDGFEHDGEVYKSLSAIAKKVTGTKWNGHVFFGTDK